MPEVQEAAAANACSACDCALANRVSHQPDLKCLADQPMHLKPKLSRAVLEPVGKKTDSAPACTSHRQCVTGLPAACGAQ